jgi:hypothetical protein
MPILTNPRREAYAQALSLGKTADEAYALAGYKANRGNASRMKANDSITNRVTELQHQLAAKFDVTRETIAAQYAEDREFARTKGQAGAMVAATTGIARLYGLVSEKQETKNLTLNVLRPYARMPAPIDDVEEWERRYAAGGLK